MKNYYRIMLGPKSIHAQESYRDSFIGGDFGIDTNLSGQLPDIWREFNQKFIPVWLSKNPGKSKVAAGLACGALWTIAGELVGQQYPTDTGPIDILAISKDKKELLVVELKKGRVSDNVVGQIQRYMGYVMETLAEPKQTVKGVIIGLEEDSKIRWALKVAPNIEFYRYQVSFRLFRD